MLCLTHARVATLVSGLIVLASVGTVASATIAKAAVGGAIVTVSSHNDVSALLRSIQPIEDKRPKHEGNRAHNAGKALPSVGTTQASATSSASAPALGSSFEGVGQGFSGPQGTFSVNSAPPDSNGTVGPNHFIEVVNAAFTIFSKSGAPLYGPAATNTLWSGFGGLCEQDNDGDATVTYDQFADRWVFQQLAIHNVTASFYICIAISTGSDPTGSYYRYAFPFPNFPDYPKLGVWPDAYYLSINQFDSSGTNFLGPTVAALDRARMLSGSQATMQYFNLSTAYGSLLPSDVDGPMAPPAGSPAYFMSLDTSSLDFWRFHVDWSNSANSWLGTSSGSASPAAISIPAYSTACGGTSCIPQAGTGNRLAALDDRLMYRLAYRNLGDHEALLANHSVNVGGHAGVRWYEIRNPGSTPVVYQTGTYSPDSNYRWMASLAMDHSGDIALGYSVSSGSIDPQIRYTGRVPGDALGTMETEQSIVGAPTGAQTSSLHRWGDYTSLTVDPSDDCTFYYTNEYLANSGSFNWHTRVGTFKFGTCSTIPSDFSISTNPTSLSIGQGASGTSSVSTSAIAGAAENVTLSASGQPSGATVSFSPATILAGGSSTLTVNAGNAATGAYTITVTGTAANGVVHSTTVALTVTPPPPPDFSLTATNATASQGGSGTSTVSTNSIGGSTQSIQLSASGAPSGVTLVFNPSSVTAGQASTLTLSAGFAVHAGSYPITITGTSATSSHSTNITLTVTASDFTIAASPSSLAIPQGTSGTSHVTTTTAGGVAQTVSLGNAAAPAGISVGFSPAAVSSGASSTMTVAVTAAVAAGSYTITVTGTGQTGVAHSVNITLNVVTPNPVINGSFETGDLIGWTNVTPNHSATVVGSTVVAPHGGNFSAQLGTTTPYGGNSTIAQTVTIPSGNSKLSFWYQPHCPDTITYDQIQMQVQNTSGAVIATLLNVCSNSGTWTNVTYDTSSLASQSVVLWFNDHDDNYPTDPTYFFVDDVTISTYTPAPNAVANPGFETGNFNSWTVATPGHAPVIVTSPTHGGTYAAQLGTTAPYNGDSTLSQTIVVPAGSPTLTFWYQPHCPDTITYDQIQMQIQTTSGTVLATVLNVCSNSGVWTQVSFNMSAYAGQTVALVFNDHDDGYSADPTYFYLDDVSVS